MIKKLLATVLLGAIGTVFASSIVMAQGLNSSLGVQTYTMFEGTVNVVPIDSTYESGSSTTRWAKGWFTDLDISGVLTFGGVMGSDLDLDGYDLVLDTDGDTAILNDRDAGVADDEIDIQIAGAVDFTLSANTLTAVDGSSVVVEDGNVAVQVDDNTNAIALDLDNDDSTNNPSTLKIANAGSGLDIDKDAGIFKFGGSGATNNEDLVVDLETGANVAGVTSTTGVADITFTGIDVNTTTEVSAEHIISTDDADINDNLTVGDVIIDEASGVLDFTGASGATITSSGFGAISFGDENLSTTGTFSAEDVASTDDADINDSLVAGDITIDEATGVLQFSGATSASILSDADTLTIGGVNGAANSENLVFDFETVANEVDITSGTGVTNLEISGMTLDMDASDILHTDSIFGSTASLPVRIGDAGTTTHTLNSEDDLLVTGDLEVDGALYPDGGAVSNDDLSSFYGTGADSAIRYSTIQTPDSLMATVGADSNGLIIAETADGTYDFAHAQQTNPTLFIQSANQSADEWVSLTHDQTDAVIDAGTGDIVFNDDVSIPNTLTTGQHKFAEDAGFPAWTDMSVSATPSAGDQMSYTAKIDGNNFLKIYSEADGSGGIQNEAVKFFQDVILQNGVLLTILENTGIVFGDNTDEDVTVFTVDLTTDETLAWDNAGSEFDLSDDLDVTGDVTATSFTSQTFNSASPLSIDVVGTGNSYAEIIQDNNAGYLAVGRTTATEGSMLSITDGNTDNEQGMLQIYNDGGTPLYWFPSTANEFRVRASAPTDDDADGYVIIDIDDGVIGAVTQAMKALTMTFGDNTDKDSTIFTLDRSAADFTLKWNETDDQFEFDAPLDVTGAMTATSFGGITEANLVDKSATEAVTGAWDFGGGGLEVPNGTTIPGTCSVGQVYLDTDSDDCVDTGAGDGAYCICKSTNTWALVTNI